MRTASAAFDAVADSQNAKYGIQISWDRFLPTARSTNNAFNVKYQHQLPDGNISIGNAIAASLTFSLDETDFSGNLENAEVTVNIFVNDDPATNLLLGYFKIMESSKTGTVTTYVAYDAMVYKADRRMSIKNWNSTDTHSTNAAIMAACTNAGINGIPVMAQDYQYILLYNPADMTYRKFLGYMASFYGCNAIITGDMLDLRAFETDITSYSGGAYRSENGFYRINEDMYYESGLTVTSETTFTVGKVVCQYGDAEDDVITAGPGTTGIGFYNPYLSNQDEHTRALRNVFCTLCGVPADTDLSTILTSDYLYANGMELKMLGDWRLQLGDRIWVKKGTKSYYLLVTQITHEFDGGLITTLRCTVDSTAQNEISITTPSISTGGSTGVDIAKIRHEFANDLELSGSDLKLISADNTELAKVTLPADVVGITDLKFGSQVSKTNGNVKLYLNNNGSTEYGTAKVTGAGATTVTSNVNGDITVQSTDTNTTYAAGTGLALSGTTINHSNSVTAGTAGASGAETLTNGGNFTVPYISHDAQGHITGKGLKTYTLPPNLPFTTCTTGATVDAKTVTLSGFTLKAGAALFVYFQNGHALNESSVLSLNVNGTGAKEMYDDYRIGAVKQLYAKEYLVMFNGTEWIVFNNYDYLEPGFYYNGGTNNLKFGLIYGNNDESLTLVGKNGIEIAQESGATYSIKSNLQIGGTNLLTGTKDFSTTWVNKAGYTADGTYLNFTVLKRTLQWSGVHQKLSVKAGETYTYSCYLKAEAGSSLYFYTILAGETNITDPVQVAITSSTEWVRFSQTIKITTAGTLSTRIENATAGKSHWICGIKLERGEVATDWSPAVTDMTGSTVTTLFTGSASESVTVNANATTDYDFISIEYYVYIDDGGTYLNGYVATVPASTKNFSLPINYCDVDSYNVYCGGVDVFMSHPTTTTTRYTLQDMGSPDYNTYLSAVNNMDAVWHQNAKFYINKIIGYKM